MTEGRKGLGCMSTVCGTSGQGSRVRYLAAREMQQVPLAGGAGRARSVPYPTDVRMGMRSRWRCCCRCAAARYLASVSAVFPLGGCWLQLWMPRTMSQGMQLAAPRNPMLLRYPSWARPALEVAGCQAGGDGGSGALPVGLGSWIHGEMGAPAAVPDCAPHRHTSWPQTGLFSQETRMRHSCRR